jgi:hypothetical protein
MITKSIYKLKSELKGADSNGNEYQSLEEMWKFELDPNYVKIEKE